jgi:hypothetical protein
MHLNQLGNFLGNHDLVDIRNANVLVRGDELDRVVSMRVRMSPKENPVARMHVFQVNFSMNTSSSFVDIAI